MSKSTIEKKILEQHLHEFFIDKDFPRFLRAKQAWESLIYQRIVQIQVFQIFLSL